MGNTDLSIRFVITNEETYVYKRIINPRMEKKYGSNHRP